MMYSRSLKPKRKRLLESGWAHLLIEPDAVSISRPKTSSSRSVEGGAALQHPTRSKSGSRSAATRSASLSSNNNSLIQKERAGHGTLRLAARKMTQARNIILKAARAPLRMMSGAQPHRKRIVEKLRSVANPTVAMMTRGRDIMYQIPRRVLSTRARVMKQGRNLHVKIKTKMGLRGYARVMNWNAFYENLNASRKRSRNKNKNGTAFTSRVAKMLGPKAEDGTMQPYKLLGKKTNTNAPLFTASVKHSNGIQRYFTGDFRQQVLNIPRMGTHCILQEEEDLTKYFEMHTSIASNMYSQGHNSFFIYFARTRTGEEVKQLMSSKAFRNLDLGKVYDEISSIWVPVLHRKVQAHLPDDHLSGTLQSVYNPLCNLYVDDGPGLCEFQPLTEYLLLRTDHENPESMIRLTRILNDIVFQVIFNIIITCSRSSPAYNKYAKMERHEMWQVVATDTLNILLYVDGKNPIDRKTLYPSST